MCNLNSPNCPVSRVRTVAIGGKYKGFIHALKLLGIKSIPLVACETLDAPVRYHADMLAHYLGENRILLHSGNGKEASMMTQLGFEVSQIHSPLRATYPYDCALNALHIGNKLICGKHTAPEIIDYCETHDIQVVFCAQGYTRCSVCVVNENAIITADPSIAVLCTNLGMDVLRIRPGHIQLDGYPYGFIGGCCGLIDQSTIAFTGTPQRHPDGLIITEFLEKHDVKYICLTDDILTDIGGFIPLLCE